MSDDELRTKKEALLKELSNQIRHERFWGDQNKRASTGLLGNAILASIGAGILGLLEIPFQGSWFAVIPSGSSSFTGNNI
jgi:hypothetical protein